MQSPPTGRARIGVDIGGTFTDLVWVDETTGAVRVGKLLTTSTTVVGPRAARLNLLAGPFP
ncbi:MAG: hypothetical protein DMD86_13960 [Candidatus Rokuibacteriota bacterium]|nr:MAG: hypothetical protein DMD86_13960 [Candidatus Rokubacteria bacterium]